MRKVFILLATTSSILSACGGKNLEIKQNQNDWCISGGPIYTANDAQPLVEAVTVKAGEITYAGDAKGDWCQNNTSKGQRKVNLDGAAM